MTINLKSNLNIAGAAKFALIESHVTLGITEYTPFAGSGTYQPTSSATMPSAHVAIIPSKIAPGTL